MYPEVNKASIKEAGFEYLLGRMQPQTLTAFVFSGLVMLSSFLHRSLHLAERSFTISMERRQPCLLYLMPLMHMQSSETASCSPMRLPQDMTHHNLVTCSVLCCGLSLKLLHIQLVRCDRLQVHFASFIAARACNLGFVTRPSFGAKVLMCP